MRRPEAEGVSGPAIELQDVWFSYGPTPALEAVTLMVAEGDFLAVLGPNGGGKTTLIKLLLGLLCPDRGRILVLGLAPGQAGGRLGYLPQHTVVPDSFPITVLDAVLMGLVRGGLAGAGGFGRGRDAVSRAMRALERTDMLRHERRLLSGLSGGERQRVFIARALVSEPGLLLLDEPTASLDGASRESLLALFAGLNREMTVVMVSHDLSILGRGVKSVACVNRTLHFHGAPRITSDLFALAYGGGAAAACPVDLVTSGGIPRYRDVAQKEAGE